MTEATTPSTLSDVCTPNSFVKENQNILTETQLNWIIKMRHKNGLAETGAVLKISRKIYLNKPKFFDWFISQNAA